MHRLKVGLLAALLFGPAPASAGDAYVRGLGNLGGEGEWGPFSVANAVSDDGSTVAGYSYLLPDHGYPYCGYWCVIRGFRWREETGMVNLGGFSPSYASYAEGTNADGSLVVGYAEYPLTSSTSSEAFSWTPGGGLIALGFATGSDYSRAHDVDASGFQVVGRSGGAARLNLMSGWQSLEDGLFSANAVTPDGSTIVGLPSFRWTAATGAVLLPTLGGGSRASDHEAHAVSADGSVVVGESEVEGSLEPLRAFRWTEATGTLDLGTLPGFYRSEAHGVSADGSLVVGYVSDDYFLDGRAFLWDAVNGMRDLDALARDTFGVGMANPTQKLMQANGISADGRTIVGYAEWPREAWLLFLPDPWTVVADNFEEGPFSVQTLYPGPGGAGTAVQTGLSGQNVLGAQRTVYVEAAGGGIPASADLMVDDDLDALAFTTPPGGGTLELSYATPAIDLTNQGREDRLVVDFGAVGSGATLAIVLTDAAAQVSFVGFVPVSPGRTELPYTSFSGSADFSQITSVEFTIYASSGGTWELGLVRTGRAPFCRDGIDNDGDGLTDHPDDPGCADPDAEFERTSCSDGLDRDGDGLVDHPEDPGCASPSDRTETDPSLACDNRLDDDGDGLIDMADPGCASPSDASELSVQFCDDGTDNDGDGLTDLADPGCSDVTDADETDPSLVCDNAFDDDGDGLIDSGNDPGCSDPLDATETDPALVCDDGIDNDGDGLVDAGADPGCSDPNDPTETDIDVCDNGIDDDGDGLVDVGQDPGCTSPFDASEHDPGLICDDGIDNDGDGATDWPTDPGCLAPDSAIEDPRCDNELDDDGDGNIDWDGGAGGGTPDPQCVNKPWKNAEGRGGCGLGIELVLLLAALGALRKRRTRVLAL